MSDSNHEKDTSTNRPALLPDLISGKPPLQSPELVPFLELSAGLLCILDFDGSFRWINEAWTDLLGYSRNALLAQPFTFFIHPEDRLKTLRNLDRVVSGTDRVTFDARFLSGSGAYCWLAWTARAALEQRLIYVAAQDITLRKEAEKAQRTSEQRLAGIVNLAAEAIITVDTDQRILFFNPAAEQIFGYSASEIRGKPLALLIPERFRDTHQKYVQTFAQSTGEELEMGRYRQLVGLHRDGTEFPIEASILKSKVDERLFMTVMLRDITERDLAQRALLQANTQLEKSIERSRELAQMAQEANQAKSAFLANMSHEIRTPMNAITGMASLLRETPLTSEQAEYVDTIRESGETLLDLINDILDFSKIEAGRMQMEEQPYNLRETVETVLDLVAVPAARKGLELAYFIEEGTPPMIVGDVTRLRQVLVNLLGNSVKFTHEGEVVLNVRAVFPEGDEKTGRGSTGQPFVLRFAVRDTGIGIEGNLQERIFQPFSQADASTARRYGGTGLGLAISRRLVEMMGGRLWVESDNEWSGSTFIFTIQATAAVEQPPAYLVGPQPELDGKRMLIVDDNISNRQMLAGCSSTWGMVVREAATADEALNLLRQDQEFDVVLLDMGLEDINSQSLAQMAGPAEGAGEPPLVAMVPIGYRPAPGEGRWLRVGLHKPVKVEQLYETLLILFGGTPEEEPADSSITRLDSNLGHRQPLCILVAEDNLVNQKVTLRLLEKMGYRADVAADGYEVLEALGRRIYDLVLMDVQMPRMDGLEATGAIRKRWPPEERPRIVAMTASAMVGDRDEFLAAGMDDYISKPVQIRELVRTLRQTRRRARPGPRAATSQATPDREALPPAWETSALAAASLPGDPQASPLDENAFQQFYLIVGEEEDLFREIIEHFLQSSGVRLDRMEQALAGRDARTLEFEAHSLKSNSATLGALRLATLNDQVEIVAEHWVENPDDDDAYDAIQTYLAQMTGELARVQEALRQKLENNSHTRGFWRSD